jgi:hypothetical protein
VGPHEGLEVNCTASGPIAGALLQPENVPVRTDTADGAPPTASSPRWHAAETPFARRAFGSIVMLGIVVAIANTIGPGAGNKRRPRCRDESASLSGMASVVKLSAGSDRRPTAVWSAGRGGIAFWALRLASLQTGFFWKVRIRPAACRHTCSRDAAVCTAALSLPASNTQG